MASIINSLRCLSDPTRLRLLVLLQDHELTVAELQDILAMGQSRTSGHLSHLKRAGLVKDRRAGKNIFYSINEDGGKGPLNGQLRSLIQAGAAEVPEVEDDRIGLQVALDRRKDKAREYFNQMAGKFGSTFVPGRSWQGLAKALLHLLPPMDVVDMGAGEGALTMLLALRAKSVIAIDSSPKMVEHGRQMAKEMEIDNLEYRLGDIENPPLDDESVDLAVFSQALHHAADPEVALRSAHRILRPGGRVLILDLVAHNFEEARELYADTWLGFSEVDMYRMLERSKFADPETSVVYRHTSSPKFETLMAIASKPVE